MQGTVTLYTTKYLNVICKCIIWSKRAAGQKGRSKRAHVKITNKRPFLTDLAIYYRVSGQKGRSKRMCDKITNKRPFLTNLAISYRDEW